MIKIVFTSIASGLLLFGYHAAAQDISNKYYNDPFPKEKLSKFVQLPVGAVKPEGWLRKQLQAWGEGITGHLQEYRSDVFWNVWDNRKFRESHPKLTNGTWWAYEHQSYWADGLSQLAYELDDPKLKALADDFVNKVLAGQGRDGYFGGWQEKPYSDEGDMYTTSLISQALMSYYSATKDARIITALQKAYHHIYEHCKPVPDAKGNLPIAWTGGSYGWPCPSHMIYPILSVYAKTGDQELYDLAQLIFKTGQEVLYQGSNGRRSDIQVSHLLMSGNTYYDMHGVDASEVSRIPAINYLFTGNKNYLNASIKAVDKIERYFEQAHGGPVSDEQFRETGAVNNTEMCDESTWDATKQTMLAITGDVHYADGIEKLVFNIGPGSRKPDGRGIQYYSAPNQIVCASESYRAPLTLPNRMNFCPDGDFTTMCCIGESNRLFPNFVKDGMWLASQDNGLAGVCYGPCTVSAKVGADGETVKIEEKTNYPFEEMVRLKVTVTKTVDFPLYLRIPGWCANASLKINGKTQKEQLLPGEMAKIERQWSSGDEIELALPMKVSLSVWNNSSVAVSRGPLVYSLKLKQEWKKTAERFPGFPDWNCTAASDWNYALCFPLESYSQKKFSLISMQHLDSLFKVKYNEVPKDAYPWEYSPVELTCKAKKVDNWKLLPDNVTPDVPQSPVISEYPQEEITLIPFGCAQVRITYFPVTEKAQEEK